MADIFQHNRGRRIYIYIKNRADELGVYMALLPSWGSLVKSEAITSDNVLDYGHFLSERYRDYNNIIYCPRF